MWILSLNKVRLHGVCAFQAYFQGGMPLELVSMLGYRPYRCRYGGYRSMAFSIIRSRYMTRRLPDVWENPVIVFQAPYKEPLGANGFQHSNISVMSAIELKGYLDLGTRPENICIDSAMLASTFAVNAISSPFLCILLPFLPKSLLYLLKDHNSKAP